MSEYLFKLCVIRPPLTPDPRYPPIKLAQETPFQVTLGAVVNTNPNDPRKGLEDTASAFIASGNFVPVTATDDSTKRLDKAGTVLDGLYAVPKPTATTTPAGALGAGANASSGATGTPATTPEAATTHGIDHQGLLRELQAAFENQDLTAVARSYDNLESRLKDSIVALRLLGIEQTKGNLATLTRRLRTIETLRKAVYDSSFPLNEDDLQRYDLRPLLVPTFAELKSILSTAAARAAAAKAAEDARKAAQDRVDNLWKDRLKLVAGLKNVVKLPAIHRQYIEPIKFDPVAPVVDMTHLNLAQQHLQLANNLAKLTLTSFEKGLNPQANIPRALSGTGEGGVHPLAAEAVSSIAAIANPLVNMSKTLLDSLATMPTQPRKVPALTPITNVTPFALTKDAPLADSTRSLFKEFNIDPTAKPVDHVVHNMNQLLVKNAQDLDDEYDTYSSQISKVQYVGGVKVQYQKPAQSKWAAALAKGTLTAPRLIDEIADLLRPAGRVTILGVADLLVVKQQLIGYEGGDIAYMENVLKGETKTREVSTLTAQSTEVTTETETTDTAETDTTTAERFEVSNESTKTIKQDESMKAGVTVSASYGPTVQVSASASYANDRSQTDSTKAASRYSKDVTTKATEKIAKRVLQRTVTKTLTQTTTKDVHALTNTNPGTQHISGVYQWQNKVYEAQVWNYGKRTMLDFMIPEPGAFYLDKQTDPHETANTLMAVPPFKAQPNELDGETAMKYGVQYGVTDLDTPPGEMSRATASYAAGKDEPHSKADAIKIPAGFEVSGISATASGVAQLDKHQNYVIITCVSVPLSSSQCLIDPSM
jgi:hypothetical protein